MAIAFVQSKSNGAANAGPFDVVLDAPATAGNLLLAFHVDGDTADNAMPAIADFTDVGTSEQYANGSGGDCNSKAWYKYAVGGETTITFPDTGGGSNDGVSGVVMEFSGVAAAVDGGPFSTAITKVTGTGSGNADNPQIATAAGDAVVLMAGAATASTNIGTFTAPANYTTNANLGTAGSDTIEARAAMAYRLSGYANPENPAAWALSGSAAGDSWNAVTLALKESAGAAPVNLVVQDAAIVVAADNVVLSPHLLVQDAAVTVVADNITLVPDLIVQDATVIVVADNVVLTGVPIDLTVQDAAVTVIADNVLLSPNLLVDDATVTVVADNVTLVPDLIVSDAAVTVSADNVVLEVVAGGSAGLEASGTMTLTRTPQAIPLSAFSWDSDDDLGDHLEVDFTISKSTRDTMRGRVVVRLDLNGVELSRYGVLWPHNKQHEVYTTPITMRTNDWVAIAAAGTHTIEAYAWIDSSVEPTGLIIDISIRVIDHS